jgi:glycosyltransferase involved in cell wall biosynthesis
LFLNRSYWPDLEATGQLLTELCEGLATRFQVTVLAGQPNVNPDSAEYRVSGRQTRHGVEICRVWHTRFSKRTLWGRSLNLSSYLLAATLWSLFMPRPDVVVTETDPPLLCLLGRLLKRRFGLPWVLYMQDIYPDVALAVGTLREGMIARVLRRILYAAYRKADLVIVPGEDMRRRMLELGVPRSRVACVPNWTDTQQVALRKENNAFRRRYGLEERFIVMYAGNLGLTQRLEHVLTAARLLYHQKQIVFLMVGDGAMRQWLQKRAQDMGLANVMFFPYQPKKDFSETLGAADIHLVPLDPRLAPCLMPSKLYNALASGSPLVAPAPRTSQLARIIQENGAGLVIPPNDPARLAHAIHWCAANPQELQRMGRAARALAERRCDRRYATVAFRRWLDTVLANSGVAVRDGSP